MLRSEAFGASSQDPLQKRDRFGRAIGLRHESGVVGEHAQGVAVVGPEHFVRHLKGQPELPFGFRKLPLFRFCTRRWRWRYRLVYTNEAQTAVYISNFSAREDSLGRIRMIKEARNIFEISM